MLSWTRAPDCWLEITGEENNLAVNFWDLKKKDPAVESVLELGILFQLSILANT